MNPALARIMTRYPAYSEPGGKITITPNIRLPYAVWIANHKNVLKTVGFYKDAQSAALRFRLEQMRRTGGLR